MTSQTNIRLPDELTRALKRRVKREHGQTISSVMRAALSSYLQHDTLAEQSANDIRAAIDMMVESNAQAVLMLREELAPLIALMRALLARFEADAPAATAASQLVKQRNSSLLTNFHTNKTT
jgi:Arc/MetJ-type ribon-helix-helix transcriptional regulator